MQTDCDIFLFLLVHGWTDVGPVSALPARAAGFCAAAGLSGLEKSIDELSGIVTLAFMPLGVLPRDPAGPSDAVRYDADWLSLICGIAARECGERISYVKRSMSLSEVCCHYVNFRRREDGKPYRRIPDGELAQSIVERVNHLAREFIQKIRLKRSS